MVRLVGGLRIMPGQLWHARLSRLSCRGPVSTSATRIACLNPLCCFVDLREEIAFVDTKKFQCVPHLLFDGFRNNEHGLLDDMSEIYVSWRFQAMYDEPASLGKNAPIAHLWKNIVGLEQVYRVNDWKKVRLFYPNELM